MIDQIYSWFSIQDIILFFSLILNFGLWVDYIDKKEERRGRKMKFVDENDKEITQDEVTDIFRYEDFLKETVLSKELGKRLLENFEEKYKKIYVVPAAN